ncbi:Fc receptor-like protein 5 [Xyrichtys novacula]|uniref:Fc receptor-like protein 5 n=1 Tax=Xyrichtys novacula TaxID=13765 RepID=A0AAV1EHQ3_XYRNO|nr:Fc receptor-like protein 5 [Xyrichtys novacula]
MFSQQQDDMEVTALCIRLILTLLFLLVEDIYSVKTNADFPQVDPNQQQFFEYEPIEISCEGLMGSRGWRVMKRVKRVIQTCSIWWETSTGPCKIQNAVPSFDSGEYWCEIGAQRSNSINITVSAGPVILEIPVLPVMEGDNVTLTCRNKLLSSNFTSQFFKDGLLMDSSSTGTMTIHGVSRLDEGLYKCSISEAGESPESWLKVRDAAFPRVVPKQQQFFEYDPIEISCEGLMGSRGWRVMKKVKGVIQTCSGEWETSTGPCEIQNAVPSFDSGEYWCEIGAKRSNSVNITVSAGPVILEIPVLPVVEGDNVTLTCRDSEPSSPNFTSQFFKDGLFMDSSSTGTMTIHGISRSNEGLYKCSISEAGESPQSWLKVREVHEEEPWFFQPSMLQICIGAGLFLMIILLLMVGFLGHKKRQTVLPVLETSPPSVQPPPSPQTVTVEACVGDSMQTTYSFANKPRKKKNKASEEASTDESVHATYAFVKRPGNTEKASEEVGPDEPIHMTYSLVTRPRQTDASEEARQGASMETTYASLKKPFKKKKIKKGQESSSSPTGPVPSAVY